MDAQFVVAAAFLVGFAVLLFKMGNWSGTAGKSVDDKPVRREESSGQERLFKNVRCPYTDCGSRKATAHGSGPYMGPGGEFWIIECKACGRESGRLSKAEILRLKAGQWLDDRRE